MPWAEFLPPPPKVFFGRDGLVQKIVSFAENLTSMVLTGTGGIGKTSIILAALHDHRIKERFGDNRWLIRCDQFPASHTHFLRKLSEAIGAGIENPEDLSSMRRHLSSKEMLIVLDNAESILGLSETNAQEVHTIVGELSQYDNICLVVTSRVSNALPPQCEIIAIPTLAVEAGKKTFYRIYRLGERSDEINDILKELDSHPLSITLLATVSQQNRWNTKRLMMEWEERRTRDLRAWNLGSLATITELSLASLMIREPGPNVREVLGVVAFFPQGVNEGNVKELFPSISDGPNMFDTFCNLSLTYRSNGFITMLAPLRDYLRPKDPMKSPLLLAAKDHYFRRLAVKIFPGKSGFNQSRWITSEDANVEHLLDVFTSIDANSKDVWRACNRFVDHLRWHKPRLVVLGSKVEALPDSHPSKPRCLFSLSQLFDRLRNRMERKRVLIQSIGIWRERRDDYHIADTLVELSDANRALGLCEEGIPQAREALDIFGRLGGNREQVHCSLILASLLGEVKQLDAAEEAAAHAMDLSKNRDKRKVGQCHRILGYIHQAKGNPEKAIYHFEASLRIASSSKSRSGLSESHLALTILYIEEDRLNDANNHIEHVKSLTRNDLLRLGSTFYYGARVLYKQKRFEEGKSEALRADAIFEKLGATGLVETTQKLVEMIGEMI